MRLLDHIKKIILRCRIQSACSVKIIIGAGGTEYEGWISTELKQLDITSEKDFTCLFSGRLIDNLLLEHVVEHIEYEEFLKFLVLVKRFLSAKAVVRIAVPDANHPSSYVRALTGVNGLEPGAEDHKVFYSVEDFEYIAVMTGYSLRKNEFFDNTGLFKSVFYDFKDGYVSRCSKNYVGRFTGCSIEYNKMINSVPFHLRAQFTELGISYTSLFVDFVNE